MAAVPSIGRASLVDRPHVAPHAEATSGLYERHAAKIQAYCHHQLGSREEAEDAVQTTFMNAFRALGRGVVPEAESAWLFKIAENVCLSRRRSSWRRGRIESPSDFEVIEEVVPGPSRQRDELIGIEDVLASMPEQQRRAILLREWQGLSYREVAEELEISQSAVETLIFRARRSLAQGLEQPETISTPKRKGLRRALRALDFGSLAAAAKTVLAGSAAVKATAAAVAVTAAAGTAATVVPKYEGHSPKSTPKSAVVQKVTPAPATSSQAAASFTPADVPTAPTALSPVAPAAPARGDTAPKPTPRDDALAAATPGATVPATHEPLPASVPAAASPEPQPQAETTPVPPAVDVKNDEGQSDHTQRHPEAVAPVAITVPKPVTVVPAPSGTMSPVLAPIISLPLPQPEPVAAPVATQQPKTTTSPILTLPGLPTLQQTTTTQPVVSSEPEPTTVTPSFSIALPFPSA